jgi:hypothetical protein
METLQDTYKELLRMRALNAKLQAEAETKPARKGKVVATKSWLAVITDGSGIIQVRVTPKGKVEELTQSFDKSGDADKWIIHRLVQDSKPGWQGVLTHSHSNIREVVSRDEALGRSVGHVQRPVSHQAAGFSRGTKLEFGVKVKETRVSFSDG